MTATNIMTLPVYPNGQAHYRHCLCILKYGKREIGRTWIDGRWEVCCFTCGSLVILETEKKK